MPKRPPNGFAAACALDAAFFTCLTGAGVLSTLVPADATLRAACFAGAGAALIRCVPSAGFYSTHTPLIDYGARLLCIDTKKEDRCNEQHHCSYHCCPQCISLS